MQLYVGSENTILKAFVQLFNKKKENKITNNKYTFPNLLWIIDRDLKFHYVSEQKKFLNINH